MAASRLTGLVVVIALTAPCAVPAQQANKVYRVGVLAERAATSDGARSAFLETLRKLGYVEDLRHRMAILGTGLRSASGPRGGARSLEGRHHPRDRVATRARGC
jgi:hypothetical protein